MKFFKRKWLLFFILLVWVALFWQFFFKGLLPIPADIITGVYFPWLDYKWGYTVGVPVKNPLISDIPSLLYPWRLLVINQFQKLQWPLWNPYYFGGMPLLANFQSAAFSYVNVFFLFLPKALAWSFGVMLSPLLTMLAVYFFLKNKKLGVLPSLLGSISFSLSGFQTAWLEYNVHGHTALFLPLLLLFIDKILGESKKRYLFWLPLLVAFQIFAGYIPIVIYTYLICGFYILFFYFLPGFKKKSFEFKNLFLILGFWLWGIVLASVQLFPGFELTQNSIRKIDPIVAASKASYLPLVNLTTSLAPDFFGNPATGNYFGTAFYDNFYFFMGTGTLILLFFSLFFLKKDKNILFWWVVLIFSFVLVFENQLGKILEKILFLSGGVSARALFMTTFSMAMLFAYGLEKLLRDAQVRKKLLPAIFILLTLFGLTYLISNRIEDPVFKQVARRNLIIPFVIFISSGFCLLSLSFDKLKKNKLFFAFVFCLITLAQLLYSTQKYLPFSKKELLFPNTPVLDFLTIQQRKEAPFRVELGEVVPQNFLMPYGLQTISGYDALLPKRTGEFLSLLQTGEVGKSISRVHLINNYNSVLYPVLNVEYLLAKKTDPGVIFSPSGNPPAFFNDPRFEQVFEDKTVVVYKDKKALPRAFWVYDFEVAEDNSDLINLLKTSDLSRKVILEKHPGISLLKETPKDNTIEWQKYTPNEIALVAESEKPGIIFISDNFYSGWTAYVDGQITEILRANYTFRALSVPEGKHNIFFKYKPLSFFWGLKVSLLALVVYCLLILVRLAKEKK